MVQPSTVKLCNRISIILLSKNPPSKRVREDRSAGTSGQSAEGGWTQNNLDFDGKIEELISTFELIAKLSTAPSLIKP